MSATKTEFAFKAIVYAIVFYSLYLCLFVLKEEQKEDPQMMRHYRQRL